MTEETEPNLEENMIEGDEEEMPKKKKSPKKKPTRKRIYNPWTRTWYAIRQRSTEKGKRGTIKGKWKPQKK